MTEIPSEEGVETRNTPRNGVVNVPKPGIWLRNTPVCPPAGMVREPVNPVDAPDNVLSSNTTDAVPVPGLAIATPV